MILNLLFLFPILTITFASTDVEEVYLNFFTHLDSVKKSMEVLKLRMDIFDKLSCSNEKYLDSDELKEKSRQISKPIFDIRFDDMPKHCLTKTLPTNCAEATQCIQRSGYYNISLPRYSNQTFMVFCNYNFEQGDWLYILRRLDGSENFQRSWLDYVNGFGQIDREYWIGLEKLYALTNYDGPQELYVYIKDFLGESRYAKYSHLVVGNVRENYALKSLGMYSGTAGDDFEVSRGAGFSTFDANNDLQNMTACIVGRKSGWWHKSPTCSRSNPTGVYYRGNYSVKPVGTYHDGAFWSSFRGYDYSHKSIVMMIRRQRLPSV